MSYQASVEARITELMDQTSKNGMPVSRPRIDYSLRGRTGGKMGWDGTMYVNVVLLRENLDHYLKHTIGHEFAHHIQMYYHPSSKPHGPEWKRIMVKLGLPPKRCHEYDTKNSAVRSKTKAKYHYVCNGCSADVFLGPVRHKKQQQIGNVYNHTCRRGREGLRYVGGLGRVSYEEATKRAASPKPKTAAKRQKPLAQGGSIKQNAIAIYRNVNGSRAEFINTLVNAGVSKNTASTYHHNIKSGRWG